MKVASRPGGDIVYMDLEEDGNLLLESLQAQFQGAIGLRYTFESGYRSVRVRNGTLLQPKAGWQEAVYFVVTSAVSPGESPSQAFTCGSEIKVETAAVDNPTTNTGLLSATNHQENKEETKSTIAGPGSRGFGRTPLFGHLA